MNSYTTKSRTLTCVFFHATVILLVVWKRVFLANNITRSLQRFIVTLAFTLTGRFTTIFRYALLRIMIYASTLMNRKQLCNSLYYCAASGIHKLKDDSTVYLYQRYSLITTPIPICSVLIKTTHFEISRWEKTLKYSQRESSQRENTDEIKAGGAVKIIVLKS